ncbi:MAG: pyruvate,water dikinase [Kiritimatiellia bacterium]|jgi:pyruvate,water dikinase
MRWRSLALLPALLLMACPPGPIDPPPPSLNGPCLDWHEATGELVCLHGVRSRADWDAIAMPADAVDKITITKHSVPVDPDDPVPTVFVNSNRFELHFDFMLHVFGELFPGLSRNQYAELVLDPENRRFWTGNVFEMRQGDGSIVFGYTVWDDVRDESRTLTYQDALSVWQALQPRFALGSLWFVPLSSAQRRASTDWTDAPFNIRGDDRITYEAYTLGESFGTLRFVTVSELEQATADGSFGWQDVLVLDQAPFDVEPVVAGAVSGTRQGELSHLAVRSAARGSPNCFVASPFDALAQFEGQLVRFACEEDRFTVRAATTQEAQTWWDGYRPDPVTVATPDVSPHPLVGLLDLDTSTRASRANAAAAYGSKGSNLAALYQRIDRSSQIEGLLVPMQHYDHFVHTQGMSTDLGDGARWHSFTEVIDAWHADPTFMSDAAHRRVQLALLRASMRQAPVDPELVAALHRRIVDVYGSDNVMVRFRSSSNAEDSLGFSGAGIYDSTSVCAHDSVDDDDIGPSACDADKAPERTIERGLKKVWASKFNASAWEERSWWGIPYDHVVMGILVNTRSKGELANVVAFTGDPSREDDRYLINAQAGELDVVSAEPGVYPEQTRLTMLGQTVQTIDRVRGSSELEEGQVVLSDEQLRDLGAVLAVVQRDIPIDEVPPEGRTVLIDSEWKVLSDGRLIIKQWRPFLR